MSVVRAAAAVAVLFAALAVPTVAVAQREAENGELRAAKALDAVRDAGAAYVPQAHAQRAQSFTIICTAPSLLRR
jgi:hypothetical protein